MSTSRLIVPARLRRERGYETLMHGSQPGQVRTSISVTRVTPPEGRVLYEVLLSVEGVFGRSVRRGFAPTGEAALKMLTDVVPESF